MQHDKQIKKKENMLPQEDTTTQTFATYLAKQYIVKKGLTYGTVPEAAALAEACDIVLTGTDGLNFQIICIIDRESHPEKKFTMTAKEVSEIGKQCLKYAGKISSAQMPVMIHVMEVANGKSGASTRLKNFKKESLFSKCHLIAWSIDTASATVWTNAPLNGRFIGRTMIEQLLREPRAADADLQPAELTVQENAGRPFVTYALLALLAAVFGAELFYAVQPSTGMLTPGIRTLVAFGGLNYSLVVQQGEWYRIFTAASYTWR